MCNIKCMHKVVDFQIVNRREQHAFSLKTVDFHIVNRCEKHAFSSNIVTMLKTIINIAPHENL